MKRALVTGAAGFIGSALCERLRESGWDVRAVGRWANVDHDRGAIQCDDLAAVSPARLDDWMDRVDVVYHIAGRAHRDDRGSELERYELYRRDNVATTRLLFPAAQRNCVQRFVYLSSIKVLGDTSDVPLTPSDDPDPQDVYAQTKLEAERYLEGARWQAATQVTVVRPPLVYGPGVKGNFAALLTAVARGWPLPLGKADAPRSLIARSNLVDLLVTATRDTANWRILHARDDGDSTVRDLVTQMARSLGRAPRLVPVPRGIVRFASALTGRKASFQRLFEPLVIEDEETRQVLGWVPPLQQANAIDEVIRWWRTQR
ncbi:MAG TPA: NAD-dependent epimerase/dehydratase family protein [Pseudomonadales bacterium]|nr:NAD-dependent epimerase/dehydratase family protein [Pseudomonadales bacterium]